MASKPRVTPWIFIFLAVLVSVVSASKAKDFQFLWCYRSIIGYFWAKEGSSCTLDRGKLY